MKPNYCKLPCAGVQWGGASETLLHDAYSKGTISMATCSRVNGTLIHHYLSNVGVF